jgi:hypothetical protein
LKKYSKILKQNISVDTKNKMVSTDDGCLYKETELNLLKNLSEKQKYKIHLVKKMFDGVIIK